MGMLLSSPPQLLKASFHYSLLVEAAMIANELRPFTRKTRYLVEGFQSSFLCGRNTAVCKSIQSWEWLELPHEYSLDAGLAPYENKGTKSKVWEPSGVFSVQEQGLSGPPPTISIRRCLCVLR